MAVEIQKTLCGGRKTENLIESTCFYLKISRVHVFCSNFSRVRMFCDDDHSKLVGGSLRRTPNLILDGRMTDLRLGLPTIKSKDWNSVRA